MTNRRDAYDLDNKDKEIKYRNTKKESSDAWLDDYEPRKKRPKKYGEY